MSRAPNIIFSSDNHIHENVKQVHEVKSVPQSWGP